MDRRNFLRHLAMRMLLPGVLTGGLAGGYALLEAKHCGVLRVDLALRHLPDPFEGMTVAFLADTHHGPLNPREYLVHVAAMTDALRPDLVLLGGDFVERPPIYRFRKNHRRYVEPGVAIFGRLHAPMGSFAVLGNHDYGVDPALARRALATHGITELTNTGVWLERGGARLRLAGVDDFRRGRPRLAPALGDATARDAVLVLTHNPDLVETITDPRVDLVLSGHTHGGQVVFPFVGAPVTSSIHGQKYVQGLRQGPSARVFVTRGVGTTGLPVRFGCAPEVVLITLRQVEVA